MFCREYLIRPDLEPDPLLDVGSISTWMALTPYPPSNVTWDHAV
jgi:hypothetical protein